MASAILVFVLTVDGICREPGSRWRTELPAEFFSGYTVTWPGAFVGAGWAGFTGFVPGWFVAFTRDCAFALQLVVMRSQANLEATRHFLITSDRPSSRMRITVETQA
ncbi:MAG: hypothetical protein SFU57_11000 [Gemmatimonadales bacterium]|nr:hypothetical protein [Gemmatimonadales bacterium]